MMDLFLVTPIEDDMIVALTAALVIDEEGNSPPGISVEHIGPYTYNSVEYPDWHTNLRGTFNEEQLDMLAPLLVNPSSPYRIFAK
jgi:hypothetical protein